MPEFDLDSLPVAEEVTPDPPAPVVPDPPAPDPAVADPAAAVAAPAAEPRRKAPEHVPLATFLEEKNKLQQRLDASHAEQQRLADEVKALKNPPPPPPDYEADPKALARDVLAKLAEQGVALEKVQKAADESRAEAGLTREQQAQKDFYDRLGATEAAFVAVTPDYFDALGHLRAQRTEEFLDMDPNLTEDQIKQALINEELNVAAQAFRTGRSPAELVYAFAKRRGYTPKAAPPAAAAAPAARAAVPAIPPPPDRRGDPTATLGQSPGDAPVVGDDAAPDPETYNAFADAFAEVFGKKR